MAKFLHYQLIIENYKRQIAQLKSEVSASKIEYKNEVKKVFDLKAHYLELDEIINFLRRYPTISPEIHSNVHQESSRIKEFVDNANVSIDTMKKAMQSNQAVIDAYKTSIRDIRLENEQIRDRLKTDLPELQKKRIIELNEQIECITRAIQEKEMDEQIDLQDISSKESVISELRARIREDQVKLKSSEFQESNKKKPVKKKSNAAKPKPATKEAALPNRTQLKRKTVTRKAVKK